MPPTVVTDQASIDVIRTEWHRVHSSGGWDDAFDRLTDEWRAVEWRSGGRTLLAALGLQYMEVPLCRGLAWLFDPNGGHGLGDRVAQAFIAGLGLQVADNAAISVAVEETREDTRADIVLRAGGQTVILEAKILAGEQPRQADRLAEHWADERLTLVFLTRTGYLPSTALQSSGRWVSRSWRDIAEIVRRVAEEAGLDPSAGAREFVETVGAL